MKHFEEDESLKKKLEKKNMDEVFKISSKERACYSSNPKEFFKNYEYEILRKFVDQALEGDTKLLIEITKNYLSDKFIINIDSFRTDTLSDINIAGSRIMKYKSEGKIDHQLADDLLADLAKRTEFIMGGEVSETIDKIKMIKDEI